MSDVKRCDNPACPFGENGTPKIQAPGDTGWLAVTVSLDGGVATLQDFDTPDCAAQTILSSRSSAATVSASQIQETATPPTPSLGA